jgi:hypothetical protein
VYNIHRITYKTLGITYKEIQVVERASNGVVLFRSNHMSSHAHALSLIRKSILPKMTHHSKPVKVFDFVERNCFFYRLRPGAKKLEQILIRPLPKKLSKQN